MRCRLTSKNRCRMTSRPESPTPGRTPSTSRATSASSSPETTPNNLRTSYADADFDETHNLTFNFIAKAPDLIKNHGNWLHYRHQRLVDAWNRGSRKRRALQHLRLLRLGRRPILRHQRGTDQPCRCPSAGHQSEVRQKQAQSGAFTSSVCGTTIRPSMLRRSMPAISISRCRPGRQRRASLRHHHRRRQCRPRRRTALRCLRDRPLFPDSATSSASRRSGAPTSPSRKTSSFKESLQPQLPVRSLQHYQHAQLRRPEQRNHSQSDLQRTKAKEERANPGATTHEVQPMPISTVTTPAGTNQSCSGSSTNCAYELYTVPGAKSNKLGVVTNTIGSGRIVEMALHFTF